MEDMPQLHDLRLDFIQPSFQAVVNAQVRDDSGHVSVSVVTIHVYFSVQLKYYSEMHKTYSELEQEIATRRSQLENDDFDSFAQQTLSDVRSLSITADE